MKLLDIFEMTMRAGVSMEDLPFPDFNDYDLKHEGKMEHGYDVYSFSWKDTIIYGVKIDNEFASYCQMKEIHIPKLKSVVLESLTSKTKKEFAGKLLSYKLRYFLNKHLGKPILLGKVHSVATENVLKKISHLFDLKMINIKTGEIKEWSEEIYKELTSRVKITDWQVLMSGLDQPFKEDLSGFLDWSGENRHFWTYGNYFEDIK